MNNMKLKYVMVDYCFAIIFNEAMSHRDFKNVNHKYLTGNITSAGFVSIAPDGDNVQAIAYGRSDSLNMGIAEDDSKFLTKMLNPEW
jgi:hypothetical protein